MPALSSFITYRPGKKAKAIMAPFSLLRGDGSTASSSTSYQPFTPPDVVEPDVIDINQSHYQDVRNPSVSFEQDVFDNPRSSSQHNLSTSPQVELDIDLSSNGFSDWLEAFSSGDPKKDVQAKRRLTRLNSLNVKLEAFKAGESEPDRGAPSEDMVASLQAMDAELDDLLQESSSLKHPYSISSPDSSSTNRHASRPSDDTMTARPLSSHSDIVSSAISGTTIARALMSNSFVLSTDRSSIYRTGTGAGLTRTDSTTLPSWEWNDRFSVGPDAPPVPLNAELLYEPPRRLRNEGKHSKQSSTGSLSPKIPLGIPSITNNTRISTVNANFDLETIVPGIQPFENPSMPPLAPRLAIDEAMPPDQASQQIPLELLSQDSDTSSPLSSCHTSPRELEGLLNYYSIPDSPELLVAARGFRPMFSPITEESSSQLSPPTPYRSDKRDSQRSQPVGARSPLRARDSAVLPMKDLHAEGAQTNIASGSSTTISDLSYVSGGDTPDVTLTPPQPNKFASIPIKVVRHSSDLDAYDLTTASSFGAATISAESPMVSQEFPETPDPFTPMISARPNAPAIAFQPAGDHERSLVPTPSMSAVILESVPAAQLLPKRTSVQHSRQGSLSQSRSTSSGSPSIRIDISESPEPILPILSPIADDAITEDIAPLPSSTSETSTNPSNISLSLYTSKTPDSFSSSTDIDSPTKSRSLPSIPVISPISPLSTDDELFTVSRSRASTIPVVLEETIVTSPSPTPSSTVKPSVPRGRLPAAITISNVSGNGRVAVNGTVQEGQNSAELESQQPQHDSPRAAAFSPKNSLVYTYRGRASDIFRGTSLGSPPPYYSVVNEALMQDNQLPNFFASPYSISQGSDNIAGPSSGESTFSNDIGRPRENSHPGQRTRTRPPLPAGPRRPSQSISSPGPRRGSFSSVSSSTMVPDSRTRPPARNNNPTPTPSFRTPTPKWKGYTLEVAKWTFTSAQLQAIVSKAIRQTAEASSIRLLRLEVLDNEIPEEIQRLESQRTNIKIKYKTTTRRRATILDSMYSSLGVLEDACAALRLARQLDELKELTQTLDRLAEELHSVDEQLSYLESLTHIHNGSALAMALRKLNSSFLQKVAENQLLRSQIQSLEAERDEAWRQAQSVANEYDQINDNTTTYSSPTSTRSSRVSAKRKSCIRVSRAGLHSTRSRASSSAGGSASATSKSPPLPLPTINKRRPKEILTDSPKSSNALLLSSSGITPTTEARALAEVQDELYSMLGIINPERRGLHRSRSAIISPVSPRSAAAATAECPRTRCRRDSLPGALSLTEAYNVMTVDRNAVLATIDMLNI